MRLRLNKRFRAPRAGLTMIEVMIAIGILSAVFLAVAFIEVAVAKQTERLYTDARTLHRAHLVMERILQELSMAQLGTVRIVDNGRTIEYFNPMTSPTPGSPISCIKFEDGYAKYYKDKTQTNPSHKTGLVSDIKFEQMTTIPMTGRAYQVTVTTIARRTWKLDRPYTLVSEVALRN